MGSTSNNSTGISADPHNLRPSDVQMNGNRGNRKFAAGSGNAGNAGNDWYPGDEWKGDGKGLWPAVEEFLESNPHWTLHERFKNNNGLTILKRI